MINQPALSVLDRLINDPAIQGWFENKQPGATPHFRFGLKLKPSAQDYPFIAVAPAMGKGDLKLGGQSQLLSIQVGVINNGIDSVAGVSQATGLVHVGELLELVKEALYPQPLDTQFRAYWDYSYTEETDAAIQHPFYTGGMEIPLSLHCPWSPGGRN